MSASPQPASTAAASAASRTPSSSHATTASDRDRRPRARPLATSARAPEAAHAGSAGAPATAHVGGQPLEVVAARTRTRRSGRRARGRDRIRSTGRGCRASARRAPSARRRASSGTGTSRRRRPRSRSASCCSSNGRSLGPDVQTTSATVQPSPRATIRAVACARRAVAPRDRASARSSSTAIFAKTGPPPRPITVCHGGHHGHRFTRRCSSTHRPRARRRLRPRRLARRRSRRRPSTASRRLPRSGDPRRAAHNIAEIALHHAVLRPQSSRAQITGVAAARIRPGGSTTGSTLPDEARCPGIAVRATR